MRTSVREVFAAAAPGYGRGNPLLLVERAETAAVLPWLAGRDVLDLGAGRGHYAALARTLGARLAVALDVVPEMLAAAAGARVRADATRLPLGGGRVDVVIAALVLSYLPDVEAALREAARVLRPGGELVLSDLHPAAPPEWRRTFATAGGAVAAPAARLDEGRLGSALAGAGLAVEARRDVAVDERLRPAFAAAGRRDFARLAGTPLLLVLRARRS